MHLEGLTRLPDWETSPPFWITDDCPVRTEPSKFLIFDNGVAHIEDLLENEDDELYEFSPRYFTSVMFGYDFDPNATCDLWEETLASIFPQHEHGDRRGRHPAGIVWLHALS